MNAREFKKIVKDRQKQTKDTLLTKAAEYAKNNDRLHNFKRAGLMNKQTPETSLWGMASKHLVSIIDMVESTEQDIYPSVDQVDEKIGDMINYLHLLEASFAEHFDEEVQR